MKKVFKPMRVFVSMLVLSSSFCFTACSNDDENTPQLPDEVTTGTMFGNFKLFLLQSYPPAYSLCCIIITDSITIFI